MDFDEYRGYDATGLAELVADKQVTAAELLTLAKERAEAVNPRINAIVRDIEADPADPRTGPFAGVPFLIKDLAQDYAGLPTSQGSRALQSTPVAQHATVVRRWIDAGLVIFGKTNLPEFGAKAITEPVAWGPARNPWNLNRTPGGSSGGSAAAVAAGIVPCAGANDGGGSIRIPAACCGLVGLKPGRGLTPLGPASGEMMHGAAVQGVVSRTVRDTASMLDVICGGEPSGPYQPAAPAAPFASCVGEDPGRLRIGVRVPSAINAKPHPEAFAAVEAAVGALSELGHHVDELPQAPFDDAALARDFLLTWFVYLAWDVDQAKRLTGAGDEAFERDTLIMAALGRATSSVDYVDAVERRHEHTRRLTDFFESYDLLLTPTLATPPPAIGEFDLPIALQRASDVLIKTRTARLLRYTKIIDDMVEQNLGWVPYTQLANLTGRPAVSLPLHWTTDSLPLGVQFVAPLGGESLLIRLAAQLEQAVPWAERSAPI
ncbi:MULTISPECIES: amidase [Mycobacterium]|uniref:amidase n=1 Tax=Mycobacterium kiyosense TaxID=2871094 RepID=A0A9P3Q4G1_9MYCO|nr:MULTISPECIES: amidase family protein [Mycobacterium]BDB39716.1 6-aminohexanoate-cyclic-dimer hydrolase [Mycobacterium kiyosense]BDE11572.1 6-aminohexanoate-cyclic-dimer hydrolase [Mycobacterium sp. 20KCMC460]GLB82344.1 6-aminohexanoate-cyclic-dimer hydrolase [Mycobacterium kiyosense]GLB88949.1 6-aminohexanoate-cyclic-dimer hydrolase [Mycobacterium kiyosense]GLB95559.1 6-aminohexanoate-cyclic-dimer hydrolase [Mycobacterium kiyosense]